MEKTQKKVAVPVPVPADEAQQNPTSNFFNGASLLHHPRLDSCKFFLPS